MSILSSLLIDKEELLQLKHVFNELDTDHDGELSKEELEKACSSSD